MSYARHRMYSRFIPSEEVGEFAAWKFGRIGEPDVPELPAANAAEPMLEVDPGPAPEPEEVKLQRAWDAGHAAGYAEGHADAARVGHAQLDAYVSGQGREHAEHLTAIAQTLADRLAQAEQALARQVLDLAAELARQMVRRELAVRPDAVLPVVREALAQLVDDHKPGSVHLHPQDLECVGTALAKEFPRSTLRWLADPGIERGGCTVESAGMLVDGTVARRWQRTLAPLGLDAPWVQPEALPARSALETPDEAPDQTPAAAPLAQPSDDN
jgi:flagellar assembly protein FliH